MKKKYDKPMELYNCYTFHSDVSDLNCLFKVEFLDDQNIVFDINLSHPTGEKVRELLSSAHNKDRDGVTASQYLETVMCESRCYMIELDVHSERCQQYTAYEIEEAYKNFKANRGMLK